MIHGISFRDGCDDEEEYIQNIKRGEEIDMVIEAYEHMICPPHLLKSRRDIRKRQGIVIVIKIVDVFIYLQF